MRTTSATFGVLLVTLVALLDASDSKEPDPSTGARPGTLSRLPERIEDDHLPNAFRIHPNVISGGAPDGDQAFASLSELGVKTIISVDGARPDVDLAKKYGLRYVHMPHGYDGVPEHRAKELAKAVRDLPGPVYFHCHHGKHRSPAAAAVACIALGILKADEGQEVLRTAGTSANYRGLFDSVESARQVDAELLDELDAAFPETTDIPALADAMVAIERTNDHVQLFSRSGWKQMSKHPDLDAAHEALLLREQYTELLRTDEVRNESKRFRQLMAEGERAARALEETLQTRAAGEATETDSLKIADSALAAVNQNCVACHREFRDVPLREKAKR